MTRIERVLAPNPSPMTLEGTNTYLVYGTGGNAIAIDPGPADPGHVRRIVETAQRAGAKISAIAVTHGHPDHAPGAALLHAATGADVYAHPDATFPADVRVGETSHITAGDAVLGVIEAPGHARDHLVFSLANEGALFTGDVIVGRGTIVIAPPNGDMRDYQATLQRLRYEFEDAKTIYGGHGEPVAAVAQKLDEYIGHRRMREDQILFRLRFDAREKTIPELVEDIYTETLRALWPAAARQVLAYLIALEREGLVTSRTLAREPTDNERAMLNPDLSAIVSENDAAVARAELGFDRELTSIEAYALVPEV
jgi:glyoxylase-like metal-dependent hydrolase (beta-lactamase superfamily II)